MTITRRQLLMVASTASPLAPAASQGSFPSKPVRILTITPPGAASDTLARLVGERVSKTLGRPIVVENRPGANGVVAARAVAKAPADGHTLLLGGASTHAAPLYLLKDVGYDPVKDFTPVTQLTINPLVLVVPTELPVRSAQEFVQYARERPGRLSYGTGNSGGLVAAQLLKKLGGLDVVGVNYAGTAQATTDLVAGRLDFMLTDPVVVKSFVHAGRLRALGITTQHRLAIFPNTEPLTAALPGFDYASWIGVFGPAGVAPEVTQRLHHAFHAAVADPDVQQLLADIGMVPADTSNDRFQAFVREQITAWARLSRDAGLTPL
ncbi:Tripartite-type tricarboxylate transporter, receptor component TctC [Variovorax sp. YR266]|uniref:Bug family tripartite tricarboxylate transporter substrate binding protein n=1 Tax=Variovorax sp. YR266 TaxID=1884386 RepID=UPI0008954057|nr:tripartite tricarboxylate transporter substrate binding protein [Variovorax sp. YR266]SDZ70354.1 Tripartite-type tricarboxylate transporter, receptor component TctC [Variovorax sp. YR266]